jgi:hypothetical protein
MRCSNEFWIRNEQELHFNISLDGAIPKNLRPLKPTLSPHGILMSTPRTGEDPIVILPPQSRLTRLIIMDAHIKAFHQGAASTHSLIQADFHVARRLVKSVIHECRKCRRFRSRPFQGLEGALFPDRVTFTRCFACIGIDFFGPQVVDGQKRYCLLITCLSSRAVHLEAVEDQSVEQTSLALRRFCALRGTPIKVYSDNAKAFKKLSTTTVDLKWLTIPERSPWWGGYWERLVGVVKSSLRISLRHRKLNFTELQTVLYELSFYVNLRPLTKYKDEFLCPASFLYGVPSNISLLNPGIIDSPIEHWRSRKAVLFELKRRFYSEYVSSLRSWRDPNRKSRLPSTGDVVLVHNEGLRTNWRLGIVERLIPGADGSPRAAFVRIGNVSTRRALERLFPLESATKNVQCVPRDPQEENEAVVKDEPVPDVQPAVVTATPLPPVRQNRRGRTIRVPARFL